MATDVTVYVDDYPGQLARVGQVLGKAGVNIEGLCAFSTVGGRAEVHVCVHDFAAALAALEADGLVVGSDQEVAVVDIEDRPGTLGEITRRLADAEVNITLAYLGTNTRLVIGSDDFPGALAALRDS